MTDVLNELITNLKTDSENRLNVSLLYPVEKRQLGAVETTLNDFAQEHTYQLEDNSLKNLLVVLIQSTEKTRFLQLIVHQRKAEEYKLAIAAFTGEQNAERPESVKALPLPPHFIPTENNMTFNKSNIKKYIEKVWKLMI